MKTDEQFSLQFTPNVLAIEVRFLSVATSFQLTA